MNYLDSLVPPRPHEMQAMEAYARETDFPIIGPTSGYYCYQVARMIGAKRVSSSSVPVTATPPPGLPGPCGRTAAGRSSSGLGCRALAAGPPASGCAGLHGYDPLPRCRGVVQTLQATAGPFDLIFNDINKEGYAASLPVIAEKLRPGGVLIVDNMLWYGRIFEPGDKTPATENVRKLTELLTRSPDWIVSLAPVRDGVVVALKVKCILAALSALTNPQFGIQLVNDTMIQL